VAEIRTGHEAGAGVPGSVQKQDDKVIARGQHRARHVQRGLRAPVPEPAEVESVDPGLALSPAGRAEEEVDSLLGVEASLTARPRGSGSSAACYLHATAADLSLGAMKLSGSAQVWSGETVLQHGSFVISRDVELEARVFRLAETDSRRLAVETATLVGSLGSRPSREQILEAVHSGVARGLGVCFVRGQVTDEERAHASRLLAEVSADRLPARAGVRVSR